MAHRCFKCGGFYADADVVNSLTSAELAAWRRISIDPAWLSQGSGKCPLDDSYLDRYVGESVPPNLSVKRCVRCGKWWFSGETLHLFKPAQEAKISYFRMWGIGSGVKGLLLPLGITAVLVCGLALGLVQVRSNPKFAAEADLGVVAFTAVDVGRGQALVSFRSVMRLETIWYQNIRETSFKEAKVEYRNGISFVHLYDLTPKSVYRIIIDSREYTFITK